MPWLGHGLHFNPCLVKPLSHVLHIGPPVFGPQPEVKLKFVLLLLLLLLFLVVVALLLLVSADNKKRRSPLPVVVLLLLFRRDVSEAWPTQSLRQNSVPSFLQSRKTNDTALARHLLRETRKRWKGRKE